MDRLTMRHPVNDMALYAAKDGSGGHRPAITEPNGKECRELLDRLAAYEDTGLEPDEIDKALQELKKYHDLGTIKKLGVGHIVSDCRECPNSEEGMFTICHRTGMEFPSFGIPDSCPLPDFISKGEKQ
jgi:hypothetical protein